MKNLLIGLSLITSCSAFADWSVKNKIVGRVSCSYDAKFETYNVDKSAYGIYTFRTSTDRFSNQTSYNRRLRDIILVGDIDCYDITEQQAKERCEEEDFKSFSIVMDSVSKYYSGTDVFNPGSYSGYSNTKNTYLTRKKTVEECVAAIKKFIKTSALGYED